MIHYLRTIAFLLSLLCLGCIAAFSQSAKTYASWYGGYILSIPSEVQNSGGGGLDLIEMGGEGDSYGTNWAGDGVRLEAHFIDFEKKETGITTGKIVERLDSAARLLRRSQEEGGLTLVHDQTVITNGHKGRELLFETEMGRSVYRYYINGSRAVRLHAVYRLGNARDVAQKFLDSIKLASRDVIAAIKVAEATPAALPQTPPSNRAKPDEDLKGRVAKIVETKQLIEDGKVLPAKMKVSETDYDKQGYTTRVTDYAYDGHPESVYVYGYLDSMRVSKYGDVKNERVFSGMMPPRPGVIPKPRDKRYSTRYEIKYDENGRVKERLSYQNNGELSSRSVYAYEAGRIVISKFDDQEVLESKTTETVDQRGNVITRVVERLGSYSSETRYKYKYEMSDKAGNWIKRSVSRDFYEKGVVKYSRPAIEHRKITYWR